MLEAIIKPLAAIATWLISTLGYPGIALAMGIESACIPLPSEIIMPFTGFMVEQGHFSFWPAILAASIGGTLGSQLAYAIGYYGGEQFVRKLIRKWGKYILVFEYELDEAQHWFQKHGQLVTFTSRLLPVVRTFISLPAGISKMDFKKFSFFAFVGTFIWCTPLGYLGVKLGENWDTLGHYFHQADFIILGIFFLLGIFYVYHKLKKHAQYKKTNQ